MTIVQRKGNRYKRTAWVHPWIVVRPSPIHGNGLFATRDIACGEQIMEFGGVVVEGAAVFSGDYIGRTIWELSTGVYLATPKSDGAEFLDEYLNHSCDPNTGLADEVTVIAIRDIATGEELTWDQATWNADGSYTEEDDGDVCRCGSSHCRTVLTDHDWEISALQVRYVGLFHPMVQTLIDRSGSA